MSDNRVFSEKKAGQPIWLAPQTIRRAAQSLTELVKRTCLQEAPRGPSWPSSVPLSAGASSAASETPGPDGYTDIYLGNPGIALALVAAGCALENPEHTTLGLAAIAPLRELGRQARTGEDGANPLARLHIGGLVGLGGLIFAFCEFGVLLRDPELLDEAHSLTELLDPVRIEGDRHGDVVFGAAGLVLALLALDRRRPGANRKGRPPLEIAEACGRRLLGDDFAALRGHGFAHGADGAGLALGRLYRATGDERYWQAARQALERAGDPREVAGSSAAASWCRGAGGMALARALLLADAPFSERQRLRGELEAAAERVAATPPSHLDHLCCGNLGRAGVLLSVHRATGEERHLIAAHRIAGEVLERIGATGRLRGDYPGRWDASLLRGVAGIAHTLLRLEFRNLGNPLGLEPSDAF